MLLSTRQNRIKTSVTVTDEPSRVKVFIKVFFISTAILFLFLLQMKTLFANERNTGMIERAHQTKDEARINNINGIKYEMMEIRDELNDLIANPEQFEEDIITEEAVVIVEPEIEKVTSPKPKVVTAKTSKPTVQKPKTPQNLRLLPTKITQLNPINNSIGDTISENKPVYNKHDINGDLLAHDTEQWSCIHDTDNGLMWEVKSKDNLMRSSNNLYSWLKTDDKQLSNGFADGGRCQGDIACDTNAYVQAMNKQNFCGHNDWRLPTRQQMQTLVYLKNNDEPVKINKDYFPETVASWYWTASENNDNNNFAWYVLFRNGLSLSDLKERPKHIRLVRDETSSDYNLASIINTNN